MPRHHDPSDTLTDAGAAGSSAHMLAFACLVGLTLAGFWASLTRLIAFSFQHEHYSHIIVVPLLVVERLSTRLPKANQPLLTK